MLPSIPSRTCLARLSVFSRRSSLRRATFFIPRPISATALRRVFSKAGLRVDSKALRNSLYKLMRTSLLTRRSISRPYFCSFSSSSVDNRCCNRGRPSVRTPCTANLVSSTILRATFYFSSYSSKGASSSRIASCTRALIFWSTSLCWSTFFFTFISIYTIRPSIVESLVTTLSRLSTRFSMFFFFLALLEEVTVCAA